MNGADKRAALEGTAPAFGVKLLSNISVDEAEKDIVERGVVTVDKYFITIEFNFGKVGVIKARWDVGIDSEWFEIEKRVIENPTGPIGQVDEHGAVGGFAGVMHGCGETDALRHMQRPTGGHGQGAGIGSHSPDMHTSVGVVVMSGFAEHKNGLLVAVFQFLHTD